MSKYLQRLEELLLTRFLGTTTTMTTLILNRRILGLTLSSPSHQPLTHTNKQIPRVCVCERATNSPTYANKTLVTSTASKYSAIIIIITTTNEDNNNVSRCNKNFLFPMTCVCVCAFQEKQKSTAPLPLVYYFT